MTKNLKMIGLLIVGGLGLLVASVLVKQSAEVRRGATGDADYTVNFVTDGEVCLGDTETITATFDTAGFPVDLASLSFNFNNQKLIIEDVKSSTFGEDNVMGNNVREGVYNVVAAVPVTSEDSIIGEINFEIDVHGEVNSSGTSLSVSGDIASGTTNHTIGGETTLAVVDCSGPTDTPSIPTNTPTSSPSNYEATLELDPEEQSVCFNEENISLYVVLDPQGHKASGVELIFEFDNSRLGIQSVDYHSDYEKAAGDNNYIDQANDKGELVLAGTGNNDNLPTSQFTFSELKINAKENEGVGKFNLDKSNLATEAGNTDMVIINASDVQADITISSCTTPTPTDTPPPTCGDGTCDSGETKMNCCCDCGTPSSECCNSGQDVCYYGCDGDCNVVTTVEKCEDEVWCDGEKQCTQEGACSSAACTLATEESCSCSFGCGAECETDSDCSEGACQPDCTCSVGPTNTPGGGCKPCPEGKAKIGAVADFHCNGLSGELIDFAGPSTSDGWGGWVDQYQRRVYQDEEVIPDDQKYGDFNCDGRVSVYDLTNVWWVAHY